MATAPEAQKRRDTIEELIRAGRWSMSEANRLAKKWGVDSRQVYRYKADVLAELVAERVAPPERRQEIIAGVEGTIAAALKDKDRKAALSGYRLLAQLEGALAVAPEVAITINLDRADPLALLQGMASALASVEHAGLLAGPVIDAEEG